MQTRSLFSAARLKQLMTDYGTTALVVYLVIFVSVLGGFYIAIQSGFKPTGVAAGVGALGAAYIATKLTQPIRIALTLIATPFAARLFRVKSPPADPNS